jgi:hypothetical protein
MPTIQYIRIADWYDDLEDDDYIFEDPTLDDWWISVGTSIAMTLIE